ncbi:Putative esterase OS=Tsukamurella paurometabola (strain ATCC 8368 / DSM / CCUG 35730 / CIP 100753/ JCM 10117 / KCTC 9821 / NBRC 16120 / NCIMB 702349 /NCTC 13040) OX=521096 GN=Tpau_2110 PE=4 SV=1 [Tsukamurella paurometabola]|uniref:Putative esterase n=1 Tax=Tsukamurella paurometabola (strain ATCC 8368 / DSM 20162 / CCUG 35730 / CIP 100753 / JCM 10117 / KCTC 9821 / NBRC 16120 / NCIMB 702349 / NCTC 13040) TaxID=521096 RepID=D5UPG5_TSUPD|nr:alpha/beta hydrolase-fold protein [Tsukamurella paurometabola]ADG78721.1 putative esterase [Tsukamurella paurometabola DSM 20162]SUP32885.1 Endo-1,4-beta-xylanase Z precursor [Tsukamurella paurometabola]
MLDVPLTAGMLPVVLALAGALGLAALLVRLPRRRPARTVALCVLGGVGLTAVLDFLVEYVWRPFPDRLDPAVLLWVAVALTGVLLAVVHVADRRSWRTAAASGTALIAVFAMAAAEINIVYSAYPVVEDLMPVEYPDTVPAPEAGSKPARGKVVNATIPATTSKFAARPGLVYFPPAYLSAARGRFPVLVLLAGQPGGPRDWFVGGKLARTMDAYAQRHNGVAPVVVVPDATGGPLANPLCSDTRRAKAASYLGVDVPAWIRRSLPVATEPSAWAVGGFSYGGTCALQLATGYPDVYRSFLALSADAEPDLGGPARTLAEGFDGDRAALERNSPLRRMATQRYPDTAGVVVVGTDDPAVQAASVKIRSAAARSGMDVRERRLPGGHSFAVWTPGLAAELDWLGARMGLGD